jgi:hypothetical protein
MIGNINHLEICRILDLIFSGGCTLADRGSVNWVKRPLFKTFADSDSANSYKKRIFSLKIR